MRMKLYNFSKKHNSTKQLPEGATPLATFDSLYLKQSTDIDSPTFLIDDSFRAANYVYLEDLGRYYFVSKNRLGNSNIYELECELDALATYKTQILSYTAFVERCADSNYYNEMFNDELVSVKQTIDNFDIALKPISEFTAGGTYVLRMAGGDADGVSTFVTDDLATFAKIFDKDTYLYYQEDAWFQKIADLIFDPYNYVVGLYWSPLKLSVYTDNGAYLSDIWCKWYNTGVQAYKLPNLKRVFVGANNCPAAGFLFGDFRKYNPNFSRQKIFIPAVGLMDINTCEASADVDVKYTIQLDSGVAQVDLLRSSDATRLASFNTSLYMSLQAGNDNFNFGQVFSNIAGATNAAIGGDIASFLTGFGGAVKNIIMPTPSTIGGLGAASIMADPSVVRITECFGSGQIPTAVAGRPCYKNLLLSNLAGFVKCAGASLELPANEAVKIKINDYLNSGFYIE